jgi:hypothetical protein
MMVALLAMAALLGVAACSEQSRVAPDAVVSITGGVQAPDGAPAADRPVKLGTGITEGEGAYAVLTVGLSCTSGACRGKVRDATTDGAGHYAFTLKGSDTQSTFGEAVSVLVSATGQPATGQVSGPMSSARFRVQAANVVLPTLPLVDPGLSVDGTDGILARWRTTRGGPYDLSFENGSDVPVWLVHTTDSQVAIDPRVLEDTAGRAVVAGAQEEAIEGSKVALRWRSPGVPYAAGAGVPPSRGRPCRYVDATGAATEHEGACPLTDADLAGATAPPPVCPPGGAGGACPPPVAAVVDLGAPVPAELVVVRGCQGGCAVEVSDDGTSFRPAGSVADDFGLAALDGRPVRAVRVGVGSGFGLREVSVWGPAPKQALHEIDDHDRARLAKPYGGGGGDDGLPLLLVVAAAVAAAAALVGVGVAVGRGRAAAVG